jgi:hypothetical protein
MGLITHVIQISYLNEFHSVFDEKQIQNSGARSDVLTRTIPDARNSLTADGTRDSARHSATALVIM